MEYSYLKMYNLKIKDNKFIIICKDNEYVNIQITKKLQRKYNKIKKTNICTIQSFYEGLHHIMALKTNPRDTTKCKI